MTLSLSSKENNKDKYKDEKSIYSWFAQDWLPLWQCELQNWFAHLHLQFLARQEGPGTSTLDNSLTSPLWLWLQLVLLTFTTTYFSCFRLFQTTLLTKFAINIDMLSSNISKSWYHVFCTWPFSIWASWNMSKAPQMVFQLYKFFKKGFISLPIL